MTLVEIWEMTAECSLNINREDIESIQPLARLSLLHKRAVRVRLIPSRSTPDILAGTIRTFGAALRTFYKPQAIYTGSTNLILLQEQNFERIALDWRGWAPKLDVWRGSGNHMTALKLPNVRTLADWLGSKLLAAD
jgi:arthrofactin-type cyclic lipopeptide synthetase C